jgi:predicted  nucleic acid-binding Zn-ribbon protein
MSQVCKCGETRPEKFPYHGDTRNKSNTCLPCINARDAARYKPLTGILRCCHRRESDGHAVNCSGDVTRETPGPAPMTIRQGAPSYDGPLRAHTMNDTPVATCPRPEPGSVYDLDRKERIMTRNGYAPTVAAALEAIGLDHPGPGQAAATKPICTECGAEFTPQRQGSKNTCSPCQVARMQAARKAKGQHDKPQPKMLHFVPIEPDLDPVALAAADAIVEQHFAEPGPTSDDWIPEPEPALTHASPTSIDDELAQLRARMADLEVIRAHMLLTVEELDHAMALLQEARARKAVAA